MSKEKKTSIKSLMLWIRLYIMLVSVTGGVTEYKGGSLVRAAELDKFQMEAEKLNVEDSSAAEQGAGNMCDGKACKETGMRDSRQVCIDDSLFSYSQIRLNTEIYECASEIYCPEHICRDYGGATTELGISYLKYMDALMPLALVNCETGAWSDSRYTWTSAVYSRPLADKKVDLGNMSVSQVDTDMYLANGLAAYLGCGGNCGAVETEHYHTVGLNDNDSLGPLQILRRYVEADKSIRYPCGEVTMDLMSWRDNVEYFTHKHSQAFMKRDNWNCSYSIHNEYELTALIAVAHNTGASYLSSMNAGSLWKNSDSVYRYCEKLACDESVEALGRYVDDWWEDAKANQEDGRQFSLAGQSMTGKYDSLLVELGINKSDYANGWGHKQYYPLKAILNYMSLERLYYSGG